MVLTGTLHSVDQYLNVKLNNVQVVDKQKYPQLLALKNCFIRGSVVRYIQIPTGEVDTELLQDAARKENAPQKSWEILLGDASFRFRFIFHAMQYIIIRIWDEYEDVWWNDWFFVIN